jgi:hypothetical protein
MEKTRKILSWVFTIAAIPLGVVVAIPLAVLLVMIFYMMTACTLLRTVYETLVGRFLARATSQGKTPPPNPVSVPPRALADG